MNKFMMTFILFSISAVSFAVELPNGWRLPTKNELSQEPLRNNSSTSHIKVEADFNGDGRTDTALLLKSTSLLSDGLFVRLSGESWQLISKTTKKLETPYNLGIRLARPNIYKTACGKGYKKCNNSSPAKLKLGLPGIFLFTFESARSIWYWDATTKEFKQTWLSG